MASRALPRPAPTSSARPAPPLGLVTVLAASDKAVVKRRPAGSGRVPGVARSFLGRGEQRLEEECSLGARGEALQPRKRWGRPPRPRRRPPPPQGPGSGGGGSPVAKRAPPRSLPAARGAFFLPPAGAVCRVLRREETGKERASVGLLLAQEKRPQMLRPWCLETSALQSGSRGDRGCTESRGASPSTERQSGPWTARAPLYSPPRSPSPVSPNKPPPEIQAPSLYVCSPFLPSWD
ncbi:uncharacterized protein LOC114215641 [Eumetopias jubatus]|uniref:uncharacterized protein LOC114215641 n=1 Tax=Eumetopias jubatus TaxID=34886 RepID=UPI0010168A7F|nr:uncharacterized protein LOC114215641 [Eumetopias jubatus]